MPREENEGCRSHELVRIQDLLNEDKFSDALKVRSALYQRIHETLTTEPGQAAVLASEALRVEQILQSWHERHQPANSSDSSGASM
jgi:hypothetical protein